MSNIPTPTYRGESITWTLARAQPLLATPAHDLRLEEDGEDTVDAQATDDLLDLEMSLAFIVVILQILQAGKLGLADQGVALVSLVFFGGTNDEGKNVGLAVL